MLTHVNYEAVAAMGNKLGGLPSLSEEKNIKLNEWVIYNEKEKQFKIKIEAKDKLNNMDYNLLEDYLNNTNSTIEKLDFSKGDVFVISPEEDIEMTERAKYNRGVTKINFYWWGARVYLSKTTINRIGYGTTIGGIWIPEPHVSKIVATVGVVASVCLGGIVFDYNYIAAGINKLIPGTKLVYRAVRNIRWQ